MNFASTSPLPHTASQGFSTDDRTIRLILADKLPDLFSQRPEKEFFSITQGERTVVLRLCLTEIGGSSLAKVLNAANTEDGSKSVLKGIVESEPPALVLSLSCARVSSSRMAEEWAVKREVWPKLEELLTRYSEEFIRILPPPRVFKPRSVEDLSRRLSELKPLNERLKRRPNASPSPGEESNVRSDGATLVLWLPNELTAAQREKLKRVERQLTGRHSPRTHPHFEVFFGEGTPYSEEPYLYLRGAFDATARSEQFGRLIEAARRAVEVVDGVDCLAEAHGAASPGCEVIAPAGSDPTLPEAPIDGDGEARGPVRPDPGQLRLFDVNPS